MIFTIEPMITVGDWRHRMWDDGWTAVTADGSAPPSSSTPSLVTDDGVEILTVRTDGRWSGDGAPPGGLTGDPAASTSVGWRFSCPRT